MLLRCLTLPYAFTLQHVAQSEGDACCQPLPTNRRGQHCTFYHEQRRDAMLVMNEKPLRFCAPGV